MERMAFKAIGKWYGTVTNYGPLNIEKKIGRKMLSLCNFHKILSLQGNTLQIHVQNTYDFPFTSNETNPE